MGVVICFVGVARMQQSELITVMANDYEEIKILSLNTW